MSKAAKKNRVSLQAAAAALLLLFSLCFALFAGNDAIRPGDVWRVLIGAGTQTQRLIVYRIRIPRILAAFASGAALSIAGDLLQRSLNNAIVSPGIIGINGGAGLFVLLSALLFPYRYDMKCAMAFLGALLVTILVYTLSAATGMSKSSVILAGVAVSGLCTSAVDVIVSLYPETVADKAAFHLGGFASVPLASVKVAVPMILVALAFAVILAPGLDILALGDETAAGLGLDVRVYRGGCILLAAVLAGAAVSMSGLLGFVGLVVPNFIRLFYRGGSRGAILLGTLGGAAFLLICDTLSRLLAFPYELPCGLLLNCIGTPFFIWLLIKKRKRMSV